MEVVVLHGQAGGSVQPCITLIYGCFGCAAPAALVPPRLLIPYQWVRTLRPPFRGQKRQFPAPAPVPCYPGASPRPVSAPTASQVVTHSTPDAALPQALRGRQRPPRTARAAREALRAARGHPGAARQALRTAFPSASARKRHGMRHTHRRSAPLGKFLFGVCRVVRFLTTRRPRTPSALYVFFCLRRNERLELQRQFCPLVRRQVSPPSPQVVTHRRPDAAPTPVNA